MASWPWQPELQPESLAWCWNIFTLKLPMVSFQGYVQCRCNVLWIRQKSENKATVSTRDHLYIRECLPMSIYMKIVPVYRFLLQGWEEADFPWNSKVLFAWQNLTIWWILLCSGPSSMLGRCFVLCEFWCPPSFVSGKRRQVSSK